MLLNTLKICILIQVIGGMLMVLFPIIFTWKPEGDVAFELGVRMMGLQAIFIGLLLYIFLKYAYEMRIMKHVFKAYIFYHFAIFCVTTVMSKSYMINGYFPNITHLLMGTFLSIFYLKEMGFNKKNKR
jgi:hypothetical protein